MARKDCKHYPNKDAARIALDGLQGERQAVKALQKRLRQQWANGHGLLSEDEYRTIHRRLADRYSQVCQRMKWTREFIDGAGQSEVSKAA